MQAFKKAGFVASHIALLALIGYQGWCFYQLFTESAQTAIAAPSSDVMPAQAGSPQIDIEKLADAHLFGDQLVEQPKPQVTIEQAPPSTREYRIASIAHTSVGGLSSVVLEVTPGDMRYFRLGSQVEPGVLLKDVSGNAILLETNGRPERIEYIKVKQPMFIRVTKATKGKESKQKEDWAWTEQWDKLAVSEVLNRLGLSLINGSYVITGESPLLSNWNVAASDSLLAVNGKPLVVGKEIKGQLQPLSQPGTVHLLLENDRRRNLVRWTR